MRLWKTDMYTTLKNLPRQSSLQTMEPNELKLTVDSMIPKPLSNKGLSKLLPTSRWDKVKIATYFEYDHSCAICGAVPGPKRLHCHESWVYDNGTLTQRLDGFIALCRPCHDVKHGVWLKQLWDGERAKHPNLAKDLRMHARCRKVAAICHRRFLSSPNDFDDVFDSLDNQQKQKFIARLGKQSKAIMPCEHFLKINDCGFRTAERHFKEAAEEWGRRSQIEWQIDYGEHSPYIRKSS